MLIAAAILLLSFLTLDEALAAESFAYEAIADRCCREGGGKGPRNPIGSIFCLDPQVAAVETHGSRSCIGFRSPRNRNHRLHGDAGYGARPRRDPLGERID